MSVFSALMTSFVSSLANPVLAIFHTCISYHSSKYTSLVNKKNQILTFPRTDEVACFGKQNRLDPYKNYFKDKLSHNY